MTVKQILGKIGQEKGEANEVKVFVAMCMMEKLPDWSERVRRATREEDNRGIDLVVQTDVGDIYLQVKSSKKQAALYKKKSRKQMIGMIVVKGKESWEKLGGRAYGEVGRLRCLILAKRAAE